MNCVVCNSKSESIFKKTVLGKYNVSYYRCKKCKAVFTESPYWLKEAYKSAITDSDVGLVSRNFLLSKVVGLLAFFGYFDKKRKFLDYAGGYGLLVRLMRDKSFDYFWKDNYCDNLFAKNFEINNLPLNKRKFELVTAFELFEHFVNPNIEIKKILDLGNSIFFTSSLCNMNSTDDIRSWWYLSSETGQHVTFYSKESLIILAKKYDLNFYTDGIGMHIFTKKRFVINPFLIIKPLVSFLDLISNTNKNIQKDYRYIVDLTKK